MRAFASALSTREPKPKLRGNVHAHAHAPKPAPTPPRPPTAPRRPPRSPQSAALVPRTEPLGPNVLAVHHWERLKSGALLASSPRIDWATLMRRTFGVDVLECPKCQSKLRILGVVDDEPLARAILTELGIAPTLPPPRARDPATLDAAPATDDPC